MKKKILYLSSILFLMMNEVLIAQPALPSEPSQAPIDGGLVILGAAGGAYAVEKIRDRTK